MVAHMTPEQVVRALTPAQREAICRATHMFNGDPACVVARTQTGNALARRGLVTASGRGLIRKLTPLGAAVRTEIKKESDQ